MDLRAIAFILFILMYVIMIAKPDISAVPLPWNMKPEK